MQRRNNVPTYKRGSAAISNLLSIFRYKEEYKRFLQLDSTKEMINKYKNVMDYLTDHSGKLIDNTGAVAHLYNLLKEEVGARSFR